MVHFNLKKWKLLLVNTAKKSKNSPIFSLYSHVHKMLHNRFNFTSL